MLLKIHVTGIKLLERGFYLLPSLPIFWNIEQGKIEQRFSQYHLLSFYFTTSIIFSLVLSCFYGIATYIFGNRSNTEFVGMVVLVIVSGALNLSFYFCHCIILNKEFIQVSNKCFELTSISIKRYFIPINDNTTSVDKLVITALLGAVLDPYVIVSVLMYCHYDPLCYVFTDIFGPQQNSFNTTFLFRLVCLSIAALECSRILGTVGFHFIVLISCGNRILNILSYGSISPLRKLYYYRAFTIFFQVLKQKLQAPVSILISALFWIFVPLWWLIITHYEKSSIYIYIGLLIAVFTMMYKICLDFFAWWGDEMTSLVINLRNVFTSEYYVEGKDFVTLRKERKLRMLMAKATRPVRLTYYPIQDIDYVFVADLFKNVVLRISDAVLLTKKR